MPNNPEDFPTASAPSGVLGINEASVPYIGPPEMQPKRDSGAGTGDAERIRLQSEKLIRHLTQHDIHPVLVFGTTASGKTTALHSLLNYAERDEHAHIEFGLAADAFPTDYPNAKIRQEDAKAFLNASVKAFAAEQLPPATQKAYPFFVPLGVTFRKPDAPELKANLAFLEGNGEWYEKQPSGTGYKPLPDEVEAIISLFTRPVSAIFVAPCDFRGDKDLHAYSQECLTNVMEQYRTKRVNKSRDRLLFLVTKWDATHSPDDPAAHFSDATPVRILETVGAWSSWVKFRSLSGFGQKNIMPYAAGWIRNNTIVEQGRYSEIFNQFNRTVWDWIYGNLLTDRPDAGSVNYPAHLYEDVAVDNAPAPGFYQSLTKIALWMKPPAVDK